MVVLLSCWTDGVSSQESERPRGLHYEEDELVELERDAKGGSKAWPLC